MSMTGYSLHLRVGEDLDVEKQCKCQYEAEHVDEESKEWIDQQVLIVVVEKKVSP